MRWLLSIFILSGTQGNPRIIKTFQASEKEVKIGNLLLPRIFSALIQTLRCALRLSIVTTTRLIAMNAYNNCVSRVFQIMT